jgi:L-2,4-diaminobutyrate decarboxylase
MTFIEDPNEQYFTELQATTRDFKKYFLNNSTESLSEYINITTKLAKEICSQIQTQDKPFSGKSPFLLRKMANSVDYFAENGSTFDELFEKTRELILENHISVYHPHCVAHLHCPTFIISLAAEMIISAFNQSMDSFDQAPAATMIEQAFGESLCQIFGFDENSDATFTGGGTMSNFMGLLLARDHYSQKNLHWNIQKKGLPPEASRFRILCSEHTHFTVAQSASILGLGENAVIKVGTGFQEEETALEDAILQLKSENLLPIAYVTTAGTTDFGEIANLESLADLTKKHDIWLHVDAAFGGSLIFSDTHKHRLQGIENADSVTIDFHKQKYVRVYSPSCRLFEPRK